MRKQAHVGLKYRMLHHIYGEQIPSWPSFVPSSVFMDPPQRHSKTSPPAAHTGQSPRGAGRAPALTYPVQMARDSFMMSLPVELFSCLRKALHRKITPPKAPAYVTLTTHPNHTHPTVTIYLVTSTVTRTCYNMIQFNIVLFFFLFSCIGGAWAATSHLLDEQ